jgi:hypothetical protein
MNTQIEEFDMNENLEIFQIIEEWKLDFHLGNAVKHILSSGKKETEDEELQDLKSASWYLTRKIQVLNNETCNWENVKDLNNETCNWENIKDLRNTTFIIPVCIESNDRYNNAKTVLGFLNKHFKTNVIIHELTKEGSKLDFIDSLENLKINHIIQEDNLDYYHRTKQLNEMLNIVKTPVVVNYDIDVILPVDSYVESQNLILNGNSDFVYPYGDGKYQREISLGFNRDEFNVNFDIQSIDDNSLKTLTSKYGHCVFANTKKYRKCGGENENFIGYGPEDQERENRFITLKYNVSRVDNLVYHFEHSRTQFSNGESEYYNPNHKLCDKLLEMDYKSMLDYYNNVEYRQKYDKFN